MNGRTVERSKILVVDDNEDLRELNRLRLEPNYTVVTAENGRDCLESLSEDIGVIFLDRRMPGLSGKETAEEIKNSPHSPAIAMLSANVPDTDILDIPCDDYLQKPACGDELIKTAEDLLSLPAHEPQLREFHALKSKVEVLHQAPFKSFETEPEYREAIAEMRTIQNQLPGQNGTEHTATSI